MKNIDKIVEGLKCAEQPQSDFVKLMEEFHNPYLVLIGCILSLRTNDRTTYPATLRMLELAKTPEEMKKVDVKDLEKAIYPVGFYGNKAKQIIELSRIIADEMDGKVPDSIDELCKFNGVGRKTANLILGDVYGQPAVVTDTHCIRITGRLGLTKNTEPHKVEADLRKILPPEISNHFCHQTVQFGRDICRARTPKCTECPLNYFCCYYADKS